MLIIHSAIQENKDIDQLITNPNFLSAIFNLGFFKPELFAQKKFENYWQFICNDLGKKISNTAFKYLILPDPCTFKQAQGLFYYYLSQQPNQLTQFFLKKAIQVGSPHATQVYNVYLYQKIETLPPENIVERKNLFHEIILNCKELINTYGSYSYIMLGEAYLRYALAFENESELVKKALIAVFECLEKANKYYNKSAAAIHNASLGFNITKSNSWGLDLNQIGSFLQELFEKQSWNFNNTTFGNPSIRNTSSP